MQGQTRPHEIWHDQWFTPKVAIDPTKDFHGRVRDVVDWLNADKLGAESHRDVYKLGGYLVPAAVPEDNPSLMQRRQEVLNYLVRDAGECLIDTASRCARFNDMFMLRFMHRMRWRYDHYRFALIFQNPRRSIRRFPEEILLMIFDWALAGRDFYDNYLLNTVVSAISATCRAWHGLLAKHGHYWTHMTTHPRGLHFYPYQSKNLRQLPFFRGPLYVDFAFHRRNTEKPLAADVASHRVDRVKNILHEVTMGLIRVEANMPTQLSRCVRLRVWANALEWGILTTGIRFLRHEPAPELRHLEVDILEISRPVGTSNPDRWTPLLGSRKVEILRIKGVTNLWEWPSTPEQAEIYSNITSIELHTFGVLLPRISQFYLIFKTASRLSALRLYNSNIRDDPGEREPILLPSMRELGLMRMDILGLQALFRIIRIPNLDRIELREIVYDTNKADFLTAGPLMECSMLDDLRIGKVDFKQDFDIRRLLKLYPRLRHFGIDEVNKRIVEVVHECLLDGSTLMGLSDFRYMYYFPHNDGFVNDGRKEAYERLYFDVSKKRPLLRLQNVVDHEFLRFGRPWSDYTKKSRHNGYGDDDD